MTISAHDLIVKGILASSRPAAATGITYVGDDSGHVNTGTSIALTLPTHATDDFAVIYAYGDRTSANISISVATGWTELVDENHTAGRARRNGIFYKKLTSASETNPTVSFSVSDDYSALVMVFRGVDTTTPLDATYTSGNGTDTLSPTAPAITTVTNNAAVLTFCGLTHSELTAYGAPSGYTLGPNTVSNTVGVAHLNSGAAYLLDSGTAGSKLGIAWSNSGTLSTTDYSVYTLALRPA